MRVIFATGTSGLGLKPKGTPVSFLKPKLPCTVFRSVEGGSVNRCFKTPVIIANAGYRKGLFRKLGCGKIAALFLQYIFQRAVEIGQRLLPIFPHLAFRETFPTWKHLFTEPPSNRKLDPERVQIANADFQIFYKCFCTGNHARRLR
jgi:hypothetical protein